MRRLMIVSGLALGFAHTALAADLDYLRGSDVFAPGPPAYANWSGFYVGGQGGFTHADVTFGSAATILLNSLAARSLPGSPQLALLPPGSFRESGNGGTFGAFAGYNSQWESVILGVEVNYNHAALGVVASATVPVAPPNGGSGIAASTIHLSDYATFRGRAGYIMGRFLPYVMLGFALGRADFVDFAQLRYTPVILGVPQPTVDVTASNTQNSTIGLGYSVGLGLDVMLTDCFFLRGEYEFVQFTSFGQTPAVLGADNHKVTLNSVRGGLGYRF